MQDYSGKWKAERERAAFLALADGTVFHGVAFGAAVDQVGEVVFNTKMSNLGAFFYMDWWSTI